ncbi:ferredoxin [Abyssalbus ytuae]|uniref:Ferredoxin n=1 Tax=Abyssalbus ytuae TaxID=2926907 RepID=A0A9E6ZKN1_9FLAO|nr:ferredoxin [Abyssalbus ytuae]UOB15950.1 ferredoxin [Abyssalbus ytuae]
MVIVTLQRNKCIGCNYCVEIAPAHFRMSKKDGKSVLLGSSEKKGFHTVKTNDDSAFEECYQAQKACPVKIISTKKK